MYFTSLWLLHETRVKTIINKIILPTLDFLKKENGVYVGFLYAGLMVKDNEPFLIEYNVRMGDPECQTILPRVKTDFRPKNRDLWKYYQGKPPYSALFPIQAF